MTKYLSREEFNISNQLAKEQAGVINSIHNIWLLEECINLRLIPATFKVKVFRRPEHSEIEEEWAEIQREASIKLMKLSVRALQSSLSKKRRVWGSNFVSFLESLHESATHKVRQYFSRRFNQVSESCILQKQRKLGELIEKDSSYDDATFFAGLLESTTESKASSTSSLGQVSQSSKAFHGFSTPSPSRPPRVRFTPPGCRLLSASRTESKASIESRASSPGPPQSGQVSHPPSTARTESKGPASMSPRRGNNRRFVRRPIHRRKANKKKL